MTRRKNMNTNKKFVYFLRYGQFKNAIEMIHSDDFDPNYEYVLDKEYGVKGTAFHAAVRNLGGYSQSYGERVIFSVINELLKKGVDPNKKDSLETFPLELAISYNLFKTTKLMLENGTNVNAGENLAYAALAGAILNNNVPMFDMLVQYGASEKAKDEENINLLDVAYEVNNPAFVSRLISKGVDVNEPFVDMNGKTASFKDRIVEDVMGKENKKYSGEEKRNKRAILKLVQEFEKKEKGQESKFVLLTRMYEGKIR